MSRAVRIVRIQDKGQATAALRPEAFDELRVIRSEPPENFPERVLQYFK